jgi:acyl-activating enzyme 14
MIILTLIEKEDYNVIKEKTIYYESNDNQIMYEKPLANNKVYLIKKLFNIKMTKGMFITQHLNNFSIIINQLSSIKIKFYDEI